MTYALHRLVWLAALSVRRSGLWRLLVRRARNGRAGGASHRHSRSTNHLRLTLVPRLLAQVDANHIHTGGVACHDGGLRGKA